MLNITNDQGNANQNHNVIPPYSCKNGHNQKIRKDRKSTRLNSSHLVISYAVFCLKKKKKRRNTRTSRSETAQPSQTSRPTPPRPLPRHRHTTPPTTRTRPGSAPHSRRPPHPNSRS